MYFFCCCTHICSYDYRRKKGSALRLQVFDVLLIQTLTELSTSDHRSQTGLWSQRNKTDCRVTGFAVYRFFFPLSLLLSLHQTTLWAGVSSCFHGNWLLVNLRVCWKKLFRICFCDGFSLTADAKLWETRRSWSNSHLQYILFTSSVITDIFLDVKVWSLSC